MWLVMKIYIFLFTFLMGVPPVTFACITCDRNIQQGIYNSAFYINLLSILFPFVVLGLGRRRTEYAGKPQLSNCTN